MSVEALVAARCEMAAMFINANHLHHPTAKTLEDAAETIRAQAAEIAALRALAGQPPV